MSDRHTLAKLEGIVTFLADWNHETMYAQAADEIRSLREAIWEAYKVMGEDPTHEPTGGWDKLIVQYAKGWRKEQERLDDEVLRLEKEVERLRGEGAYREGYTAGYECGLEVNY
jgi:hypothetical protein